MMATPIDVSFRADISNLSKSLATLPGITKKEAKEMVKGLESEIKKAERAAVRAAKKTEQAWGKTQKQFKTSKIATDELSGGMKSLKDQSGETDSVLKAFGGAIGTISPEAERAFMVLGDLSGGVEALARSSVGFIGPIALVTAAVSAGVFAWNKYSDQLEEAEKKAQAMAEATAEMVKAVSDFKADRAIIELETLVATGQEEIETLDKLKAERRAAAVVSGMRAKALEREAEIQARITQAEKEHTEAMADAAVLGTSTIGLSFDRAQAKKQEAIELEAARAQLEQLDKKEAELTETILAGVEANKRSKETRSGTAKATKEQADAIDKLIEKVAAFEPPLSEFDQMATLLDELTDTALESEQAMERLAPAIEQIEASMDRLQESEAAEALQKLKAEADRIGQVSDPIGEASAVLAKLKAEAQQSEAAFEGLAPDIQKVGQHLEGLKIAEESSSRSIKGVAGLKSEIDRLTIAQQNFERIHGTTSAAIGDRLSELTKQAEEEAAKIEAAYLGAFGNMTAAGAQFAGLRVDQIKTEAEAEMESRQEVTDHLENQLAATQAAISSAATEEEAAKLRAAATAIRERLQQEEEATAKIQEIKNKELAAAFKAQQAFNVSQVLMNTAVAVIRAIAELGPIAGPIAAGSIGVLGAAQLATIAAQEPPTAHMGGMVGNSDEKLIKARTGEGVLTAQGVQAIGGAQGVANANAGMNPGGGTIVVQQVYKHRVLDTVIQDSINKGGPISQAINRRNRKGRRNPYRRSG